MNVQDVVYNWLTVKVVVDELPDDEAAKETYELFDNMLREEQGIEDISYEVDDEMYIVTYEHEGKKKTQRFLVELVNTLLNTIKNPPKTT